MKKRSLFLLLAGMLSLASCGKKDVTPPGGSVSSVSISQESMEVQLGKRSSDITVTVSGEGDYNKNVKLVSENEAIAKASFTEVEDGGTFKVYGIAAGETRINLVSIQDESKATSLSVSVKPKEEAPGISEILSVSLSKETHLFHVSDAPLSVTVRLNGRGTFDDSVSVVLPDSAPVSIDKTTLKDGESFLVTPLSVSNGETSTIKVQSVQDETKYAELVVRVDEDIEPETPEDELSLNAKARTLTEGGSSFEVTATTSGGVVQWSFKEDDATTYVDFEGTPTGNKAKVRPIKATPEDKTATLVARLGNAKAECKFRVAEKPTEYRTYYLSNNSFLSYQEVYFYTWGENGEENAPYPGVKLTDVIQNTLGEDCYKFQVDVLTYVGFKFSDGGENNTVDAYYTEFGSSNNVWYDGEGAHFATIEKDEPTVSFFTNSVSIYKDEAATTFGFNVRKGDAQYEVTSGASRINVTDFSNGSISIEGLELGSAAIRVYIPGEHEGDEDLAEDFLYVEVLDLSSVKTFYFSNSKHWTSVFLYAWNDEEAMNWPGIELTNPLKNKEGEDVYLVHLAEKYEKIIFSNGDNEQTNDITLATLGLDADHDNIWISSELNPYNVSLAKYEPFAYSVHFAQATATVYEGKNTKVGVNANALGVSYNITEGSDSVQLVKTTDNSITLKWLKVGTAKIVATLHSSSDELTVTCSDAEAPDTTVQVYFTNNFNWSEVYLYMWNENGSNDWPGEKLENPLKNTGLQDVYILEIDVSEYEDFIVNSGNGQQSVDISIYNSNFATNNNIYLLETHDSEGHFYIDFANFEEHVHVYDPITHQCECGDYDPDADIDFVDVRFVVNYNTSVGQDLYIYGIGGWDVAHRIPLTWSDGNNWFADLHLAVGVEIGFKFVMVDGYGEHWEKDGEGNERRYTPTVSKTETLYWGLYD